MEKGGKKWREEEEGLLCPAKSICAEDFWAVEGVKDNNMRLASRTVAKVF
jgi:hypothetical protein